MDDLGIGILFAHLFDAAVDIAEVRIKPLHDLSLQRHDQAEYTVCRRVLRAHIDEILLFFLQTW